MRSGSDRFLPFCRNLRHLLSYIGFLAWLDLVRWLKFVEIRRVLVRYVLVLPIEIPTKIPTKVPPIQCRYSSQPREGTKEAASSLVTSVNLNHSKHLNNWDLLSKLNSESFKSIEWLRDFHYLSLLFCTKLLSHSSPFTPLPFMGYT